jgi:formylaminopyrimidine deformylase / aminopyrimidine aminohydrolase
MRPTDLLARHTETWHAATHHRFLDGVQDGSLAPETFATWLVQDYHFVFSEISCLARLLARAPRYAQHILVRALVALEAEAGWFEAHARQRNLSLHVPLASTTAAYRDFLLSLDQEPFPVALSAIWAVERAYLEAWMGVAPGHERYRAYVVHWANAEFKQFVSDLEQVAIRALAESNDAEAAEQAFLQVAHLEHDFWEMAWSGGGGR